MCAHSHSCRSVPYGLEYKTRYYLFVLTNNQRLTESECFNNVCHFLQRQGHIAALGKEVVCQFAVFLHILIPPCATVLTEPCPLGLQVVHIRCRAIAHVRHL